MTEYITSTNVADVIKQIDKLWEARIKHSYKLRKMLTHKQWRSRNTSFEYEFKVSVEDFWEVYCYIKYNSKHCWVKAEVETFAKYRCIKVYAFV